MIAVIQIATGRWQSYALPPLPKTEIGPLTLALVCVASVPR